MISLPVAWLTFDRLCYQMSLGCVCFFNNQKTESQIENLSLVFELLTQVPADRVAHAQPLGRSSQSQTRHFSSPLINKQTHRQAFCWGGQYLGGCCQTANTTGVSTLTTRVLSLRVHLILLLCFWLWSEKETFWALWLRPLYCTLYPLKICTKGYNDVVKNVCNE